MTLMVPEEHHRERLRAILSDPKVMAELNIAPSLADADASLKRHAGYRAATGLGFWVAEVEGEVAGFCGLKPGAPDTAIAGQVEIGWIFDTPYWGKGFASEEARAALAYAWSHTDAVQVFAITGALHDGSRRVMERIGMRHLPELDFPHSNFPIDDVRSTHVIYAVQRPS